jgi:hypothetical protein
MKNLSQDNWSLSLYFNPGPLEYKAGVLTIAKVIRYIIYNLFYTIPIQYKIST